MQQQTTIIDGGGCENLLKTQRRFFHSTARKSAVVFLFHRRIPGLQMPMQDAHQDEGERAEYEASKLVKIKPPKTCKKN
jgi:hypothetical protein